ncbi:MAG: GNAT family N-acetyltransferase [Methyloligellaceae bacterium]
MVDIIEHNLMLEPEIYTPLSLLYKKTFGSDFSLEAFNELSHRDNLLALIAWQNGKPAAFKVGYTLPEAPDTLYSWIGGTLPEYQNQGIAWDLMMYQHLRASELGLNAIETKSMPKWEAMMRLNYKAGFCLVREYISSKSGELKYLLRKELNETC